MSLTVIMLAIAPVAATEISTDLWVYQYGDTVNVSGIDFGANETVELVTTDPYGVEVDRGQAQTDEFGSLAYSFVLLSDVPGIYDVVATGLTSGLTAATQFDPPNYTFTVDAPSPASVQYSDTVTFSGTYTCKNASSGGSPNCPTTTFSVTATVALRLGAGGFIDVGSSTSSVQFTTSGSGCPSTCSVPWSFVWQAGRYASLASVAPGTYDVRVTVSTTPANTPNFGSQKTLTSALTITNESTSTTYTGGPGGTTGTSLPLSATVADADGGPPPAAEGIFSPDANLAGANVVTFQLRDFADTANVGAAVTASINSSGNTTGTPSLVLPAAGSYKLRTTYAGNTYYLTSSALDTITVNPIDSTPPVITKTITGTLGANGWYTSDVTVDWTVSDPESAWSVTGCVDVTHASETTGITSSCSATSSGGTSSDSATVKIDKTGPSASLAVTVGTLGLNGWYTSAVTVGTSGADGISGPATCTLDQVFVSDTAGTTVNGSCTNQAGLTTNATALVIKIDATGPTAALSVTAGTLGLNGWYVSDVTVHTSGADDLGPVTCTPDQYQTTETAGQVFTGTCTDNAGHTTSASPLTVKLDLTAPSISDNGPTPALPDGLNGWYVNPLTNNFSASDGGSGLDAVCALAFPKDVSSGASEGSAVTVASGSCSDLAGNTAGSINSVPFKIDLTAPDVTAAADRSFDYGTWYNSLVTVSFTAIDGTSGVDTCDAPVAYNDPDDATALVSGSCVDFAGNVGYDSLGFMYDDTAPTVDISAGLADDPDLSGWYNISTSGTDGVVVDIATYDFIGVVSLACTDNGVPVAGPLDPDGDSFVIYDGSHFIACTAKDAANNAGSDSESFDVDQTDPVVSVDPDFGPDYGTWYNAPVLFDTSGSDLTSGLSDANCTADQTYTGPDGLGLTVSGNCTDNAGNTAGASSAAFDFDDTDPVVSVTPDRAPDNNGWYSHSIVFNTSGTDVLSGLVDTDCSADQSYAGPDGIGLTVGGSCTDAAGNVGSAASAAFKYDDTNPTVSITHPVNGSWYSESNWDTGCLTATGDVCGTAADPLSSGVASGVGQVNVSMRQDSTGNYWNWTTLSFSSTTELFTNAGGAAWNKAFAYGNFPLSGSFTLHALAVDLAGNIGNASATFTLNRYTIDYQQPLDDSVLPQIIVNKGKYGRVIPTKVVIYKDNVAQTSANFGPGDVFTIGVNHMTSCASAASDAVELYADAGASNGNTNLFRWADGQLIYNLDTKASAGVPMVIGQCYRLDIYLNGVKLSYSRIAVFQPIK